MDATGGMNTSEREFYIWRLEYWWIAANLPIYYPIGRIHIIGPLFWKI